MFNGHLQKSTWDTWYHIKRSTWVLIMFCPTSFYHFLKYFNPVETWTNKMLTFFLLDFHGGPCVCSCHDNPPPRWSPGRRRPSTPASWRGPRPQQWAALSYSPPVWSGWCRPCCSVPPWPRSHSRWRRAFWNNTQKNHHSWAPTTTWTKRGLLSSTSPQRPLQRGSNNYNWGKTIFTAGKPAAPETPCVPGVALTPGAVMEPRNKPGDHKRHRVK